MTDKTKQNEWLPLEATPAVWTKATQPNLYLQIIHDSGADPQWKYIEINELDPDALAKLPPTIAIICIVPLSEGYKTLVQQEQARLAKLEQSISPNVIFFRQTGRKACGMIALLHSLANNEDDVVKKGKLHDFLERAASMSPKERAQWLDQSDELSILHNSVASGENIELVNQDFHYVCFVTVDDHLYELDGQRPLPVNHGKTDNVVQGAMKIIKQYVAIDPDQHHLSVIALVDSK